MTTVEALHELRRMAQPTCWRCEGRGIVRRWNDKDGDWLAKCPSCAGTGSPERAA